MSIHYRIILSQAVPGIRWGSLQLDASAPAYAMPILSQIMEAMAVGAAFTVNKLQIEEPKMEPEKAPEPAAPKSRRVKAPVVAK